MPPTGDWAQNAGTCPDLKSKSRPIGTQDDAQPTEPPWPKQFICESLFHNLHTNKNNKNQKCQISLVTKKQYQAMEAALCFLISLPHSAQKIPLWTGFCFLIIILDCSHSIFCHNPISVETIIKTMCLLQGIPIGSHRQRKGESTGSQVSKELSSDKDQN